MKRTHFQSTPKTPLVVLKPGLIHINGKSYPENSVEFYKPITKWIDEYIETDPKETVFSISLEFFNTSSSKCILDILKKS